MALGTDEIVDLLEGFTHRMTVRNFHDFEVTEKFSDTQMATLVRFLVGERPEQPVPEAGPTPAPVPARQRERAPRPAQTTDWQERLKEQLPSAQVDGEVPEAPEPAESRAHRAGRRTSEGLELDSPEFEGVTLP